MDREDAEGERPDDAVRSAVAEVGENFFCGCQRKGRGRVATRADFLHIGEVARLNEQIASAFDGAPNLPGRFGKSKRKCRLAMFRPDFFRTLQSLRRRTLQHPEEIPGVFRHKRLHLDQIHTEAGVPSQQIFEVDNGNANAVDLCGLRPLDVAGVSTKDVQPHRSLRIDGLEERPAWRIMRMDVTQQKVRTQRHRDLLEGSDQEVDVVERTDQSAATARSDVHFDGEAASEGEVREVVRREILECTKCTRRVGRCEKAGQVDVEYSRHGSFAAAETGFQWSRPARKALGSKWRASLAESWCAQLARDDLAAPGPAFANSANQAVCWLLSLPQLFQPSGRISVGSSVRMKTTRAYGRHGRPRKMPVTRPSGPSFCCGPVVTLLSTMT